MTPLGARRADAQGAAVPLTDPVSTESDTAARLRPASSGAVRVGRNSKLLLGVADLHVGWATDRLHVAAASTVGNVPVVAIRVAGGCGINIHARRLA